MNNYKKSKSWITVDEQSDFPIQNLPFGIFETQSRDARAGIAVGDYIVDLAMLHEQGFLNMFDGPMSKYFHQPYLNDLIGLGKKVTNQIREKVGDLLDIENALLRDNKKCRELILVAMTEAKMLMPVKVGDYTDFYSSKEHATNVGTMFRDPENALLPNWKHLPVGYHGRASSIIPSGVPIHRPKGQTLPPEAEKPVFGPTKRLDFELEMAFITGKSTQLGESISIERAEDYIFGFVLFNDWSARDIQKWEYVPLGPFLAKSFGSSISPWIVTLEALEPFRTRGPEQSPRVLPYLDFSGNQNFDIELEVGIIPSDGTYNKVCGSNFKYMYWNVSQQLAHQTVNGCNINIGDMYASGTISGPTPDSYGSMLELSWMGTKPIRLSDGTERKFIEDGDTVVMKGYAGNGGVRIGFGELRTQVLPSK